VIPAIAELTAPALFVAGATTSLHCALMCGAINAAQVQSHGPVPLARTLGLVHGGRVLGYALLGLVAGALGARLSLWLPEALGGRLLQGLAALALIVAGLQQWRGRRLGRPLGDGLLTSRNGHLGCAARRVKSPSPNGPLNGWPPQARLFAQGLLWALMPCGILYTVVLLAALTASPVTGFFLLAAFGLGTVPLMGVSGGLFGLATRPQRTQGLRRAAGAVLVTLGVAGLALALSQDGSLIALLCAPR
jgi:sulfite exporter TauE/SafE